MRIPAAHSSNQIVSQASENFRNCAEHTEKDQQPHRLVAGNKPLDQGRRSHAYFISTIMSRYAIQYCSILAQPRLTQTQPNRWCRPPIFAFDTKPTACQIKSSLEKGTGLHVTGSPVKMTPRTKPLLWLSLQVRSQAWSILSNHCHWFYRHEQRFHWYLATQWHSQF